MYIRGCLGIYMTNFKWHNMESISQVSIKKISSKLVLVWLKNSLKTKYNIESVAIVALVLWG